MAVVGESHGSVAAVLMMTRLLWQQEEAPSTLHAREGVKATLGQV
jgi:hypothetical protein